MEETMDIKDATDSVDSVDTVDHVDRHDPNGPAGAASATGDADIADLLSPPPAGSVPTALVLRVYSLSDQIYSHEDTDGWQRHWNASEGRRLARLRGAEVFAFRPAEHGIDLAHILRRCPGLDEGYAKTKDLAEPLLFLPYRGASLLVDGWHRLLKAILEGVGELPALHLTPEEADRCLLMVLPPGRGIPLDD